MFIGIDIEDKTISVASREETAKKLQPTLMKILKALQELPELKGYIVSTMDLDDLDAGNLDTRAVDRIFPLENTTIS